MDQESVGPSDEAPPWKRRVDRILPLVIGCALAAALGALLYFAGTAAQERDEALAEQRRSYEIMTLARRLDASIARSEATLARYVVGMDKDVGRVYQDQWKNASAELEALRLATREDAGQARLLAKLSEAFRTRGAMLSDIALRTNYDQKIAALGKYYQASKDPGLARISTLLDQIVDTETSRLEEHSQSAARAGASLQTVGTTYRLAGLALVVALLVAAWVARSAIRERRREQRLIDEEYHRAQKLESAVAARTAELELAYEKLRRETDDRARMEESLRQLQKMEAVGRLTGGIAHDFNNMLTIVVGGLELARRRVKSSEARRHIDSALDGAGRASALTRRLLAFARSEPNLPEPHDPDSLVIGMADLLDRAMGDQLTIKFELDCGSWQLHADRHQFENALLNLAANARDAMEGRGTLVIRTRQSRLAAREIGDCPAGEYILLSVIDTGRGMNAETLSHAFEPFYTTKPVGKGTGLGLSQVFGFIGQCGGEVRLLSEPEKGTEVHLYFPRHTIASDLGRSPGSVMEPASRAAANEDDPPPLRILVVEDDPRVLAQTRSALMELGHEVIGCGHPHNAISALDADGKIDLILSDVLMPDMTGPEMIAALPAPFRSIPVIFATGYAGEVESSMFEGHELLRKPYTLTSLRKALAQASRRMAGRRPTASASGERPRRSNAPPAKRSDRKA